MTIDKLPRSNTEEPRSTAYYYADLERFKRTNHDKGNSNTSTIKRDDKLTETPDIDVKRDVKLTESPAIDVKRNLKLDLDRHRRPELPPRQCSLPNYRTDRKTGIPGNVPEYSTPEGRQGETYSTAGTFPLQKEKEPLLAELEVVGRVPLTQLSSSQDPVPGISAAPKWVRRRCVRAPGGTPRCDPSLLHRLRGERIYRRPSQCILTVTAERDALARALSLERQRSRNESRPYEERVTELHGLLAPSPSQSILAVTAERDALARALSLERQRSRNESRAYEERVTELHGVIAELVRRRDGGRGRRISEGSGEDECESTTQPVDGIDPDEDRTDQNDTSLTLSPLEVSEVSPVNHDICHRDSDVLDVSLSNRSDVSSPPDPYDTSLHLTDHDDTDHRCPAVSSCERERGSVEDRFTSFTASPGRFESRQAKLASRIKLKRTGDTEIVNGDSWSGGVEKLSLSVCADADDREAIMAADHECCKSAMDELVSARVERLEADVTYLTTALHTATDTAARLSTSVSAHEAASTALCLALKASDRAIEVYDVLLALAEAKPGSEERATAERVAGGLLEEIEREGEGSSGVEWGETIHPGPWASYRTHTTSGPWSSESECRLRGHVQRLKTQTTNYRGQGAPPNYTHTELDAPEIPQRTGDVHNVDMEKAIMIQEVLSAREEVAAARLELTKERARSRVLAHRLHQLYLTSSNRRKNKKDKQRHWLEAASETDL